MRLVFVLLFGCACSMLVSGVEHHHHYPETLEHINVDGVLDNEYLYRQYINCILDQGSNSCTPEGHVLKLILPEAIKTICKLCSPKQREMAKQVGNFLRYKKPEDWALLQQRFDPTGEYFDDFERFLDS